MDLSQMSPDQALRILMEDVARKVMVDLRTHVPATVLSFARRPRAEVSVRIDMLARLRTGETMEVAQVDRVPVLWPAGGGFTMDADLRPGDQVLLEVFDRDISGWLAAGDIPAEPATGVLSSVNCSAALAVSLRSDKYVAKARPVAGEMYLGADTGNAPWMRMATVPTAKMTVEAPAIHLGQAAVLGVARQTDPVAASPAGTTLLTNIQLALAALAAIPANAAAAPAIAAVLTALPAGLAQLGVISGASTIVKSR